MARSEVREGPTVGLPKTNRASLQNRWKPEHAVQVWQGQSGERRVRGGAFTKLTQNADAEPSPSEKVRVQLPFSHVGSRPSASKIGQFTGFLKGGKPVKPTASTGFMERAMGIEPNALRR